MPVPPTSRRTRSMLRTCALLAVARGCGAGRVGSCEFPANVSGVQCDMDLGARKAARSAADCAALCCADDRCAAWQWSNASCGASAGCGCWLGHRNADGTPRAAAGLARALPA